MLKTKLNKRQRDFMEKVLSSSDVLLNTLNDVLDYSKIEANKLTLEYVPFDLRDVLRRVTNISAYKAQCKGVELLLDIDKKVPFLWIGDPIRLGQILINLASNAVKFTEQGEVIIRVKLIAQQDQQHTLRFSVIDTGIGIDKERIDQLFSPFIQMDSSITRKYGGTGLGMSITNSLVTLMQGTIELTSVINKGTSVHVVLPLKQVALVANNEHVAIQFVPDMGDRKILIAEDNKINQIVIQTMLKATQADVTIVDNGLLAVEAFAAHHFDLVLMDIHMPEMDGIEAQKKIKQMNDQVPIIALTANVMANDVAAYLNQGFVAHIGKPIDMQNLFDVLQRYN